MIGHYNLHLVALSVAVAVRNARLAASLQLAKDAADAALHENRKITAELREAQSELIGSAGRAAALKHSIEHAKEIVLTQQSYAGAATLLEPVRIAELVEDAVRMSEGSDTDEPRLRIPLRSAVDAHANA